MGLNYWLGILSFSISSTMFLNFANWTIQYRVRSNTIMQNFVLYGSEILIWFQNKTLDGSVIRLGMKWKTLLILWHTLCYYISVHFASHALRFWKFLELLLYVLIYIYSQKINKNNTRWQYKLTWINGKKMIFFSLNVHIQ